jgi:hypothetical protein
VTGLFSAISLACMSNFPLVCKALISGSFGLEMIGSLPSTAQATTQNI